MIAIIRIELYKLFRRKRSYIGFGAIAGMCLILALVYSSEGDNIFDFVTTNLQQTFTLHGNLLNGNLFTYLVLKSLWVHIPILIALVTGDIVSGEREAGTLRMLISRPVSRSAVITAKFIAAITYVMCLTLILGILSYAVGRLFFGNGDLLVLMHPVNLINQDDIIWRFLTSYLFGLVSMSMIATFSVFMSTISRNTVVAILTTIATILTLNLISTFGTALPAFLRPLVFTSYLNSWQLCFSAEFSLTTLSRHVAILVTYMFIFYGLALYYFKQKDITS